MHQSPTERSVVLIVEDEFLIRMAAAEAIGEAGFEVIQAANADEAISLLEARQDVRVVFTDIKMPGSMDGMRLAHAVRHRWPPIRIIATSGHYDIDEARLPLGSIFFRKPYSPHDIARTLNALTAA
jgi:two-component system, response regulator PdtaR